MRSRLSRGCSPSFVPRARAEAGGVEEHPGGTRWKVLGGERWGAVGVQLRAGAGTAHAGSGLLVCFLA